MTTGVPAPARSRPGLRAAGWMLHLYTASGAVLALLAVLAAIAGDSIRVLWILLIALVIDGTDGMLARRLQVSRHVPEVDGARLDDIVDYLTYAFAPVVLLLTTGRLPGSPWGELLAAAVLLASCLQFCRTDAKTEDHYFLGFPSYWNVVAFYAIVLDLGPLALSVVLVVCVIGVFVPVRYLYPSRTPSRRGLNIALAAAWLALYVIILATLPDPAPVAVGLSLAYLAYYVGASVLHTVRSRRPDGDSRQP